MHICVHQTTAVENTYSGVKSDFVSHTKSILTKIQACCISLLLKPEAKPMLNSQFKLTDIQCNMTHLKVNLFHFAAHKPNFLMHVLVQQTTGDIPCQRCRNTYSVVKSEFAMPYEINIDANSLCRHWLPCKHKNDGSAEDRWPHYDHDRQHAWCSRAHDAP